ncbi:MAG TPA: glycosyltransferase [bacterium]|nr:glycosyltransferase [bacterium]
MARRILLYSHDTVGLGHIRRVAAIGKQLATEAPDDTVLILTGSDVAGSLELPPNVDYVKLPSVRKVTNSRYAARKLRLEGDDVMNLRAELIRETFRNFDPDLLIVDKAPLGVHGDLLPTLKLARQRNPRCRIVLSLRDILDTPHEVIGAWEREGIHDALRRYYDLVLVWGEERIYDMVTEYRLPSDVAAKVQYCGYIGAEPDAGVPAGRSKRKKLVLVTVGGGQDGYDLLETYLQALAKTKRRFASVVLLGPDLPAEKRDALRATIERTDAPVFAVDYAQQIDRLMRSADLCVTMGGYNTMCEVVSRGRPAVVVPRVNPRQEQLIRATKWQELGLLRMIHPDTLSPTVLAEAIDSELTRPRHAAQAALDFGGLDRAAKILRPDFTPQDRERTAASGSGDEA